MVHRLVKAGLQCLSAAIGGVLPALLYVAASAGEDPSTAPDPQVFGIELSPADYNHWSFRPIVRPAVPNGDAAGNWSANPIDAFVWRKLSAAGLSPSPPADDRAWLRRVTFDLLGLPPTPEEVDRFLADRDPARRERVVDRLLADPGYGIRWGRRWLDVARYADTNGYERDSDKPHAWRYRDWVVDSLNADKPFDRFLTEQLAGDELPEANAETMIGATFLRLGTWDDEPADPQVDRYDQLDDVLGTASAAFLGLSLRCARCHNHKFEPLSQLDYTRMLAIFEPLQRPRQKQKEFDVPVGTRHELAEAHAAQTREKGALDALEAQIRSLDERVRERHLHGGASGLSPEALAAQRLPDRERTPEQKKLVRDTQKQLDEELIEARTAEEKLQRSGFEQAIAAVKAGSPHPLPRAYLWQETADAPPMTQVFRRGSPAAPAGAVAPGFPEVLRASHVDVPPPAPGAATTCRRLALARWLTDPRNPLAARVIVNRLWQGHFGEGIVATENDFGLMGQPPSHPELLDWLAAELREPTVGLSPLNNGGGAGVPQVGEGTSSSGNVRPPGPPLRSGAANIDAWRLKRLHRLIVLSRTYAQSSGLRTDAAAKDPENQILWRFPYRRIDAEALRDSVLAVSGRLNPQMGGPGVYPKVAREVLEGQSRPGSGWGAHDERAAARRSIYIFVKRSLLVPEMEVLDFADTTTACEQRPVSTIPTQALTLLNGDFLNEQARHFAQRVRAAAGGERAAQLRLAYRLALSREPTPAEQAESGAFLDRQAAQVAADDQGSDKPPRDPPQAALEAFCLVLFNLNEFTYVD